MSARSTLETRRAALAARAAAERDQIAGELAGWRAMLANADRGLEWVAAAKRVAPVAGVGAGLGLAALAMARPRLIAGVLGGGFALWRIGGTAARIFSRLRR